MHLWSVQVRYGHPTTRLIPRTPITEKSGPWNSTGNFYGCKVEDFSGNFAISPGKPKSSRYTFVVKAMGKKNPGNSSGDAGRSIPEGDGHKEHNPKESKKSSESANQRLPFHLILDWRELRAQLFAREQAEIGECTAKWHGDSFLYPPKQPLGLKWAHPISLPETGSVLVATEKLDGVENFERTVILLLKSGTRNPREGPFGIIINRPTNKKIKQLRPTNPGLSKTLADCSLHIGGPVEASMFLVRTGDAKSTIFGFEEVLPGLCFGLRNSLDDAITQVQKGVLKPQDFRFFLGYAGWQYDQLLEEIEAKYWHVAACSANLIFGARPESSENLWEEILQLMGGQYSELSRKPKQDM